MDGIGTVLLHTVPSTADNGKLDMKARRRDQLSQAQTCNEKAPLYIALPHGPPNSGVEASSGR